MLFIVLTENYETTAQRAGKHFEYKEKKEKYMEDSKRFLRIKDQPILQKNGIHLCSNLAKIRGGYHDAIVF